MFSRPHVGAEPASRPVTRGPLTSQGLQSRGRSVRGPAAPAGQGAGSVALRVSISPDPSHPSAPEDWPSDEFSCPWGLQERTRRKRNPGPAPCLPRAHHPAPSCPSCASFKECLSGAAQGTVHLPGAPEGKARRKAEVGRWQVRPDSNSPLALDPACRLEPARRAGGGGVPSVDFTA